MVEIRNVRSTLNAMFGGASLRRQAEPLSVLVSLRQSHENEDEAGSFVARATAPTKTAHCRIRSGKASVVTQDAEAAPTIACETEKPGCCTADNQAATCRRDVQATAYQHVMPGPVAVQAERNSTCGDRTSRI